ncbi:DNA cytosine methyltransferase [Herbaspirillum sp. AP02]|uniref:DNA cytosine methyltransferase n=1 Tax=unclassified Herbaspirillum TaxID=2624150 RepID=UPI0015D998D1|nr:MULTISPECIES: DNA cytosine methyltransferase [unclassified Herbaspirillum]MBG7619023.1 DNA cytosine methyltransferase [Herbaspirillum sp. AP02]NZD66307.1 DNA cytosine methyltransferase [Herbaspirillum sp. AP21]
MERPIGVDLFAGAGGLSLGFEQAGFDIAAAIEIDPIHCATHEYNFPKTKVICASVVDLSGDQIRERSGIAEKDIDVVFGGAPCQGFSMIGKRALDDQRNQLVFHFVRLVKELRPKYCVFENVKGLTLGKHSQFLTELVDALGDAGYDIQLPYKVLNAANFGVPQSRERLFLLGARRDQKLPQYPNNVDEKVSVRDAIADLPDANQFKDLQENDSTELQWATESDYALRLRGMLDDADDFSHKRIFNSNLLSCSLITEHTEISRQRFLATKPGQTEKISRFLRLDPEGVCNTLRAGTDSARGAHTSPRPIHPVFPRVITVREAARLHSYPDWFRLHATKWHGFRQIGNSVPPLLGRAVAAEVIKALGVSPTKPADPLEMGNVALLKMNMGEAAEHFSVSRKVIAQRERKVATLKPAVMDVPSDVEQEAEYALE